MRDSSLLFFITVDVKEVEGEEEEEGGDNKGLGDG